MSSLVRYLENDKIKIGVSPDAGGRMVYISRSGQPNMLKSADVFFQENQESEGHPIVEPSLEAGFVPYDGLITWLGPQGDWWVNQDVDGKKKRRKDVWPPDPYLIYGRFKTINETDTSIILQSAPSPISNVVMTKEYVLHGNALTYNVTIENTWSQNLSWDIWNNGRFNLSTGFFVPAVDQKDQYLNTEVGFFDYCLFLDHDAEGTYSIRSQVPEEDDFTCWAKAFLFPKVGHIVAVQDKTMLVMQFDVFTRGQVHRDQALVEIFIRTAKDTSEHLLELENHSEFRELKPGQRLTKSDTWYLFPYEGEHVLSGWKAKYKSIQNSLLP